MRLVPGLAAQAEPEEEASDILLVDHDFVGINEIVRVFLQAKQVYRAELNSPDVTVALRPAPGTGQGSAGLPAPRHGYAERHVRRRDLSGPGR